MHLSNRVFPATVLGLALFFSPTMAPVASEFPPEPIDLGPDVLQLIHENILIKEDGTCTVDFYLVMPSWSPFAEIYRTLVGLNGNVTDFQPIQAVAAFVGTLNVRDGSDWDPPPANVPVVEEWSIDTPATVSVHDQLVDALLQLHKYSLGITIQRANVSVLGARGTGGACVLWLQATGTHQKENGSTFIGPLNIEESFERAASRLMQIEQLSLLLRSKTDAGDTDARKVVWDVYFDVEAGIVTNQTELDAKAWSFEFDDEDPEDPGKPKNAISASIQPSGSGILLREELSVVRTSPTKDPSALIEGNFLCYKTFRIEYDSVKASPVPELPPEVPGLRGPDGKGAGSVGWSWEVWESELTLDLSPQNPENICIGAEDPTIDIVITLYQWLNLSGNVEWEYKWFKLREFKAYLDIGYEISLNANLTMDCNWTLERPVFEYSKPYVFVIWFVPVEVTLGFSATAGLDVSAKVEVNYTATADGDLEAGVKWKRGKGWSPIRDLTGTVDIPEKPDTAYTASVTPSLRFQVDALFYDVAGPYAALTPSATVAYTNKYADCVETPTWTAEFAVEAEGGIEFSGWLKKAFGLNTWSWKNFRRVLWEWAQCTDDSEIYDVAVSDFQISPSEVFVTSRDRAASTFDAENVDAFVTVTNVGWNTDVFVRLTLEATKDGQVLSQNVVEHGDSALSPGVSVNVFFPALTSWTWEGDELPDDCDLSVSVEIIDHEDDDADTINNTMAISQALSFKTEDIAVKSVAPSKTEVSEGDVVPINVTIASEGNVGIPSALLYAYYDDADNPDDERVLISRIWCEHLRVLFELPPESGDIVCYGNEPCFKWDTTGVPAGTYQITVDAPLLELEYDPDDNLFTNVTETVTIAPQFPCEFESIDCQVNPSDITVQWAYSDPSCLCQQIEIRNQDDDVVEAVERGSVQTAMPGDCGNILGGSSGSLCVVCVDGSGNDIAEVCCEVTCEGEGGSQRPGDCNQDGALDLSDAVFLLGHLFLGQNPELPCGEGTLNDTANVALLDSNGDEGVDLSDAVYILSHLFLGGPPPVLGTDCVPIVGCPMICVMSE